MTEPKRGRPPKLNDHAVDEFLIDALLANWARMARGWPENLGYASVRDNVAKGVSVDEDAAQAVESVLCELRQESPRLWRVIHWRYIAGYTDQTIAREIGKWRRKRRRLSGDVSTSEARAVMRQAYAVVEAALRRGKFLTDQR